jgi:hypothetical protein
MLQHDYKGFSPGVTMETVTEEDWRAAPALQESPVTSAICEPANGAQLEGGTGEVSGQFPLSKAVLLHLGPLTTKHCLLSASLKLMIWVWTRVRQTFVLTV